MSLKSELQGFDISKKSAVIVGCGGLGTNAAVHLAGSGIGRLLLVDFDVVEDRNLNRQFFYSVEDIGKEKSRLLAERLRVYAPEIEIDFLVKEFDGSMAEGFDIIIAAVDNIETRRKIGDFCKKSGIPCVNGGINGFFGTAYLFVPGETPDLEAAGCLAKPGVKPLSPSPAVGMIGALEAKLAIDCFLNKKSSQSVLYCFDDNKITALKLN